MEHGSKEYYKEQSKYWHNELIKCSKQRDELKRKLDDVVDLFNTHLHHKKSMVGQSLLRQSATEIK